MSDERASFVRQAFFNGNGLARRMIVALVVFSSIITAVITAIELYSDYRHDLRQIDRSFQFVGSSYLPTLTDSVWVSDREQVQTQLDGLLRLPDIEYIGINENGESRWSAGQIISTRNLITEIALVRDHRGQRLEIGTLTIVASVDRVLARLWDRLLIVLISNGIKTLLVAGFMLLLFQWLVTRHLTVIAEFVRRLDPRAPRGEQVQLMRPETGRWRPDVLDQVTTALNTMSRSLHAALTDLHQSEAQLAQSEQRFRLAMEAAGEGLWDYDLRSERVYYSPGWGRILGLEPVEVAPSYASWESRLHPDDRDATLAAVQANLDGRTSEYMAEHRLRTGAGGWRWVLGRGRVVERDASGASLRMVGTMKDIDQRKQAETALRESEVRLRGLTEHTSAFIYELDHEGRITFANRTYAGLTRQQVEGTLLTDWLPPELKGRVAQSVARAFASPDLQQLEYAIADPAGKPRAYVATIAPMLHHGVSTSAVLTAVDITDQKATEQAIRVLNETLEARVRERTAELQRSTARAETASRAKSEFLSHMSHELRTPLNAILGFAQILELSNPSEKQRSWAQEIRRAGDHLLQLIEELFDLSRIEVGQLTLSIEPLALMPIVREAINIVQSAIDARGIRVDIEDCLESVAAHVDGMRLRQILVNYLSNAVKYNRDGGHILIACEPAQHNRVRLTVTDTGPGIAPQELPRLFQPFDRLGAKARGIEGTGIGLALSKQLAELMGATVGADSTVGKGSTFWIDLPLAVAPPPSALPHAPAPMLPADRSIRVLYVEDNLSNLEVVRTFLAPYPNVKLYTTADGAEGVAVARSHKPDLILLDIHMPQMDGFAVLRKLQSHPETRTIPVVALSADAMPGDVARGLTAGFVDYLAKPVSLQALLAVIARFSVRSG